MWIKPVVIFLLLALFISLFTGLVFFVKDQGSSRRTFHSLGVRLCIAVLLFAVTGYGLYTGELGHRVPWDPSLAPQLETLEGATGSEGLEGSEIVEPVDPIEALGPSNSDTAPVE